MTRRQPPSIIQASHATHIVREDAARAQRARWEAQDAARQAALVTEYNRAHQAANAARKRAEDARRRAEEGRAHRAATRPTRTRPDPTDESSWIRF